MAKTFAAFQKALTKSKTEEEVKSVYARHFNLDYDTEFRHDLYSKEVFFEFKFSRPLNRKDSRAAVLAQVMYYVRRLRLGYASKAIPPVICIADSKHAFFTDTVKWRKFYSSDTKYDWELAPSTPDQRLVSDLAAWPEIDKIKVLDILDETEYKIFSTKLEHYFAAQLELDFRERKLITEDNFEEVFEYWNKCFGASVRNGTKSSRYFLCDIQEGRSVYDRNENKVIFLIGPDEKRAKKILPKDYEWFWSNYEKVTDVNTIRNIIAKVDRLTDEPIRRMTGEFFTPVAFARKAHDIISRVVGAKWWTKNYRLWDMAAGTGNLEWLLPADSYKSVYLSTLHGEDTEHCKRLFPGATVFKYDYLNNDIDHVFSQGSLFAESLKLPENLVADLANPEIKWIVFINPPFATSQKAGTSGASKKSVSETKIRPLMHEAGLGEVSRELFAQFLYRIREEFKGKTAHLGLFSTLKYVNANNDQKFRDKIFQFKFEDGFVFSSANFSGTKAANPFPVGFLLWNLSVTKKLEKQVIEVSVLDDDTSKLGRRVFSSGHRSAFLSKWIDRIATTEIFPPLGGAITVKAGNADVRDRVAKGFLGSLMCKGNDVQNHNNVALLSGPYVSAGALSIVATNFDKALIIHAVRRAVKKTWLNDRDQFLIPKNPPSVEFTTKCVVWSLFGDSNQTASLRNISYKGGVYQMVNEFFPYPLSDVRSWPMSDLEVKKTTENDRDRFVSKWLEGRDLDVDSVELLKLGKIIYKEFFEKIKDMPTTKYKVEYWDVGWWQVKKCLEEAELCRESFDRIDVLRRSMADDIRATALDLGIVAST